jgi:putative NADPH-quinone reductase
MGPRCVRPTSAPLSHAANVMAKRIAIIQGHPDARPERLIRAMATAYAEGARAGGHEVRIIDVAAMEFPLLRTKNEFNNGTVPMVISQAQCTLQWADHLVIFYPLWLGTMPALLHAFFEQAFRHGFAAEPGERGEAWKKLLAGRSARIVVTMGMPALVYRWLFRAHRTQGLERRILDFAGIGPVKESLYGRVEARSAITHDKWLAAVRDLGRQGM